MTQLTLAQAEAYIAQKAPGYGLDPAAVLAVASQEGLSQSGYAGPHPDPAKNAPNAFAVGPFQLNSAGALGRSPAAGWGSNVASSWAWSTDGIDWALGQIASVAHGLSGSSAVNAIVSKFEISGDISGEESRAQGVYPAYYAKYWNQATSDVTGSAPSTDPGTLTSSPSDPTHAVTVGETATSSSGSQQFTLVPGFGSWPGIKVSFGFLWAVLLFAGGIAAIIAGLLLYFHKEVADVGAQVGKVAAIAAV